MSVFTPLNATIVAIRKFVALEVLMAAYRKRKNKDGSISHTATVRLKVDEI